MFAIYKALSDCTTGTKSPESAAVVICCCGLGCAALTCSATAAAVGVTAVKSGACLDTALNVGLVNGAIAAGPGAVCGMGMGAISERHQLASCFAAKSLTVVVAPSAMVMGPGPEASLLEADQKGQEKLGSDSDSDSDSYRAAPSIKSPA